MPAESRLWFYPQIKCGEPKFVSIQTLQDTPDPDFRPNAVKKTGITQQNKKLTHSQELP